MLEEFFWLNQAKNEASAVGRPGATLFEPVQGGDLPAKQAKRVHAPLSYEEQKASFLV